MGSIMCRAVLLILEAQLVSGASLAAAAHLVELYVSIIGRVGEMMLPSNVA